MRPALLLLALALGFAAPARAADPSPPPSQPSPATELFVELVVNGQPKGALAPMTQAGSRLAVDAASLRAAGVTVTGEGAVDVATLAGVRARYDAAGQRLLLDVDPALLPLHRITASRAAPVVPTVDAGILLNYGLFVQAIGGVTRVALSTEQRVFGPFGSLSNSGVASAGGRLPGTPAGQQPRQGYVRLDTRYQWVDERRSLDVTAGDLITRALPWTRAVRIGGVQLSRDFGLRPDLITVPLPSFAGQAAVPTGVDLFIDGYRQGRAEVAPGRFVLDSVPVVNGAGEARIVTTDALGRQIATVIPFYVAPELLRPGLSDFALAAGALRRGYGLSSFRYGRMVASGALRHGVTPRLTLSAHGEAARGLAGVGIGAAWAPGLWGALNGALAVSEGGGRTGRQLTLGYTYSARRFAIGAEHVARTGGYRDIGSFDLARFAGSRRSDRISVSLPIDGVGSVGAGYLATRFAGGGRVRLASASLSLPIGRRASAFVAGDYDLDRRAASAQFRLILPFGGSGAAAVGMVRDGGGGTRVQASAARTAPADGGLGYALDIARNADGTLPGQASATWQTAHVHAEAGAATSGRAGSAWASVEGAAVLLDGHLFAARTLPGAFAVVATGTPRVPVFYENRRMGQTDRGGRLFVPNVVAWHPGRFAIDPVELPPGYVADLTETRAALRAGAGGIVRLPVVFHRSATAHLVDAAGRPLPPGSLARIGDRDAPVGWDGEVVLEGPPGPLPIRVATAAGICRAVATMPAQVDSLPDIGVVACR